MVIFLDGPRNTGKSFLLNYVNQKIVKFPMQIVINEFQNFYDKEQRKVFYTGISLAKDLSFIDFLDYNKNMIVDRSPISSLVYGELFDRMNNEQIEKYIDIVSSGLCTKKYKIILVTGNNPQSDASRQKDTSEFSDLEYKNQLDLYMKYSNLIDEPIIFENKFNPESIIKFKKLIEETINEYK